MLYSMRAAKWQGVAAPPANSTSTRWVTCADVTGAEVGELVTAPEPPGGGTRQQFMPPGSVALSAGYFPGGTSRSLPM